MIQTSLYLLLRTLLATITSTGTFTLSLQSFWQIPRSMIPYGKKCPLMTIKKGFKNAGPNGSGIKDDGANNNDFKGNVSKDNKSKMQDSKAQLKRLKRFLRHLEHSW
jgi:hypothetical protein